jgi:DNA invertase Pin-like site-specific DNA recombinase
MEVDSLRARRHCFLSIISAIHQMERELRAERAAAGRATANGRGKTGRRPRTDGAKLENARILYESSGKTAAEACAVAGVGRRAFFSYLAKREQTHASGSEGAL